MRLKTIDRKLNSILSQLSCILFLPRAYHKPLKIQIETSGLCNFRCKQCALTNIEKPEDCGMLNYKDFCKIIDSFKHIEYIEPYGLGECLLNKDIFKMLSYIKSKNKPINIDITTNGSLINEEVANNIVNIGVERINVSLDGANAKAYEKIRKGANFDQTINNIKLLINTRNNINCRKPKIVITLVIMEENVEEIESYVRLGKELNVDEVHVQGLNKIWSRDKSTIDENLIIKNISLAKKVAMSLNVEFVYPAIYEQRNSHLKRFAIKQKIRKALTQVFYRIIYHKHNDTPVRCTLPWGGVYITNKGYITPCCMIADPKILNFGNIIETPFNEIWNSKKFIDFRYEIACGHTPDICKYCFESRQGASALFCVGY